MAIAAVSREPKTSLVSTPKTTVTEVTFDNSYPTGGEAVTAADLGLSRVDYAIATVKSATGGGVNVANVFYNIATGKILVYDETPAEAANAADLSTLVVQVIAWGR
jgi:hypothetical protein